jgi:3-(3-hydroxy-phenyl)propionate hydroxylase
MGLQSTGRNSRLLQTRVIVVGAGPCGVTIANYLGLYGIETILIDREAGALDYPRAVGIDDEALRGFQAIGLIDQCLADMIQNQQLRYYDSRGRCFAQIRPQAQPFGWPRRNGFLQPLMEATLRRGLERFSNVRTLFGHELVGVAQDESGVRVEVRANDGGATESIQADYLVGADGGRSTVRRLIGIELEGSTSRSRWLVADVENCETYAPYAGNYIHSVRPHMSIDLPYGHRRFEFRMSANESEEEMIKPETLERLLQTHFPNHSRQARLKRARVYSHHSRVAQRFQVGRVFLAGDAAHLQPPWFGQGMNSGLRDAANISWKLAATLMGRAPQKILESYDVERRGHATAMVNLASFLGFLYSPKTRVSAALRALLFRTLQLSPAVREYILQMRFKPMPRYREGIIVHTGQPSEKSPVGRMFIQPWLETKQGQRLKLDDAIGPWFAVIGINFDAAADLSVSQRAFWSHLGTKFIRVNRSRAPYDWWQAEEGTLVLDDVDGAFRDWLLERPEAQVIVMRPDRYVAAVSSRDGFAGVTEQLRKIIGA